MINLESIKNLYPFAPRSYNMNGNDYRYVDEGEGDPLLMVHGNPSWSFLFRRLIAELRSEHRVVAPDHLGFGMSDKPCEFPYRLETHIDNLETFVLGLDLKNITMLVHDWGGPIGLGVAIRHPERFKRLIITNTAAFADTKIPLRIAAGKIPWLGRRLIVDLNLFLLAAVRMTVVNPLPPEVRNAYLLPFKKRKSRLSIAKFVEDIPISPQHASIDVLLGIEHGLWMLKNNPVAIIWGMRDWCFTPHFLERWIDVFPHAEVLELENAGHWLFEDAPEDIIPFVRHFIESD
ncbi:MAG: alpha/beta fold hydrolase [Kiritimatiellaeota bacterium]|nr:alpha/beta fold hydrolase [Kiritimatiellota bacterium]